MYAVVQSGNKQYRVARGQKIRIEKLSAEAGTPVELSNVLMIADGRNIRLGTPFVDGGKVTAEVVEHGRCEKIRVVKFNRRKHSRKQSGHRQWFTEVRVTGISS